ncbi:DUF2189 domain-containing protein [Pseudoxanthomonas sp. PXM01]|uniref:DUF2189 domain-containing protein n=1 Tax=Pseudoxanthomonas sp. PXM01 TaxID=2769295 RepID=UPI001783F189|nr:DUF2189 domain-containing protein [Pseudoxanthomonas sp. PXM01]MBD9468013.1 DUF2189 domain-containing protein [Pseudoxanthomonas sp. PXM01]
MTEGSSTEPAARPFVVPCADLDAGAPWRWLRAGWRDVRRAPGLTLLFGMVIVLVSLGISWLAYLLGRFALLATLLSGFVFVAPLLCVGLYCVSRALEQGRTPRLRDSFVLSKRVLGQAGVYALGQGVIILLWSRAGMMVSAFFPFDGSDPTAFWEFLALGSAVGAVFAALTFAVTAFSLPMIADRDVDMVTAAVSSVHAVMRNKRVMVLWGLVLVTLTVIGFATALLGLGLLMPWLAYASWHGYRETLDASGWAALE